jgi:hypothetical protein
LDVSNGNNINFYGLQTYGNVDLFCISVDDPVWAANNEFANKDAWTYYLDDCNAIVEPEDPLIFVETSVTARNGSITIQGYAVASIFNILGQNVYWSELHAGNNTAHLRTGVYFVYVNFEGSEYSEKVILAD